MRIDHVGVLALVVGLFGGNVEAGQERTDMKLEDMGFITPREYTRTNGAPASIASAQVCRAGQGWQPLLPLRRPRLLPMRVRGQRACHEELSSPQCAILRPPDANRIERWDRRGGVHSGN